MDRADNRLRLACGGIAALTDHDPVLQSATKTEQHCDHYIQAVPYVIDAPGRYCLNSDVHAEALQQDAILINAHDVEIDGGDFALIGPKQAGNTYRGILAYDRNGIRLKDLRIDGFHTAVLITRTDDTDLNSRPAEERASNIEFDDLQIQNATFQGIHVRADDVTITDSSVTNVGGSSAIPHAYATGMQIVGNRCRIENNRVVGVHAVGNGEAVGIALYGGSDCYVSGNFVEFLQRPEWGDNFGFWIGSAHDIAPRLERNKVVRASYVGGPYGSYADNSGELISCSMFVRRPSTTEFFEDRGGNALVVTSAASPSEDSDALCKHDVKAMAKKFHADPSATSAYAVARAWQEQTAIKAVAGEAVQDELAELYAWLLVAAKLGHPLAQEATLVPSSDYTAEIQFTAKKRADHMISALSKLRLAQRPEGKG